MPDLHEHIILKDDVFDLTAKARHELGAAGTLLSAAELEVLVLLDGNSTVEATAARLRQLQNDDILNILRKLLHAGLIDYVNVDGGSLDFLNILDGSPPAQPSATAVAEAEEAAAATTALLLQQGYVVRIARRATSARRVDHAKTICILVIEDEQILANLLKVVLEAEGYEVRHAMTRQEISAALSRQPLPDLVLLDLMLPGLDGFEVLLKIRQHPALKHLPVVILTAKTTRDAVLKGLASGADGYLTKPFDIPVLVKAVHAVLGLTGERSEPA